MSVRVQPLVTRDILLRASAPGVATATSVWRRLQRENIVTAGVRAYEPDRPGGPARRQQLYASSNVLSIILAEHVRERSAAESVRAATSLLETDINKSRTGLARGIDRLWHRDLPGSIRVLRGVVTASDGDAVTVLDTETPGQKFTMLTPTTTDVREGAAIVVVQIGSEQSRWTTVILPGEHATDASENEHSPSHEYLARTTPTPDVEAELDALIARSQEPRPLAVTLA